MANQEFSHVEEGQPSDLPGDVRIKPLDVVMAEIDKAEQGVRAQIESGQRHEGVE